MFRRMLKYVIAVGQQVYFTVVSGLKVVVFSKTPKRLAAFHGSGPEACVILGNGPSLKETLAEHPEFLVGKKTLCTNDFVDSEYFSKIKPDYYIFADPTYWSPAASDRFKTLFAHYQQQLRAITWPMVIFMPMAARNWNYFHDLPDHNPHLQFCYYNTTEVNCPRALRFWLYRHNLAIPPMQNVMVAGIFVCLNMGFKKSYLLGGDHSWHESLHVDGQNKLFITNSRFQDKAESNKSPFFEDPGESEPYNMHKLFHAFSRMYLGYMELEVYAASIGAKIFNASKRSYIDAFERINLDRP